MMYVQQPMYPAQTGVMNGYFGTMSQVINCPYCGHQGQSMVHREAGMGTWLICMGICFFTGCCGPIAFCIDGAMDAVHHCATCGRQVGIKTVL